MVNKKGFQEVMKDPKGYLDWKEIVRIMEAAKDNPRDRLLILLLAKTGRRTSEILALKPKDIDFENKMILWNILKKRDKSVRWIPVDNETMGALYDYINIYRVNSNERIIKITRQRVFQIIRKYGKEVGVSSVGEKRIHPHHFRHSFAIWFVRNVCNNPEDLEKLRRVLQHSSIHMTEFYLQFSQKDMRESLAKMPDLLGGRV